jgi:co-chaperonin GroES (HSP10)
MVNMEKTINYEPLGNHIVVEMPQVEKETVSGIIKSDMMLKEEADKRDGHAKVVAVSQDVKNVKVGDTVIPKGQGFMVMVDEVEYFQMNMFDVLGIVKA